MGMHISETLRRAIVDSGLPLAAIAGDSGAALTSVRRFVIDGKDVRLSTAVDLAASLGYELCLTAERRKATRSRRH
jgi:hypothetical protein